MPETTTPGELAQYVAEHLGLLVADATNKAEAMGNEYAVDCLETAYNALIAAAAALEEPDTIGPDTSVR